MSENTTIARPYAKAIFELAQKEKKFDEWSNALFLASSIASDERVRALMKDPNFSSEEMNGFFLDLGKETFFPQALNLLKTLGQFKRLNLLPEIAQIYEQLREQEQNITTVQLISAFELTPAEQKQFKEALMRRMNSDVVLDCSVDKKLIGGAIIRAGDLIIDGSIRGRIAKLGETMGIS